MADIIPPGYMESSLRFRHSSLARSAYVTLGFKISDVPTVGTANAITEEWRVNTQASVDDNVTVGPTTLRVGQDGGENLVVVGTSTWGGNAAGSTALNGGQALLIHKFTARGGRRGRGRMYLPWVIRETDVNEVGVVDTTVLSGWQTVLNTLKADLEAISLIDELVVLHSPSAPDVVNPTSPGDPNIITSWSPDSIVGTQRRRLGRGG